MVLGVRELAMKIQDPFQQTRKCAEIQRPESVKMHRSALKLKSF